MTAGIAFGVILLIVAFVVQVKSNRKEEDHIAIVLAVIGMIIIFITILINNH